MIREDGFDVMKLETKRFKAIFKINITYTQIILMFLIFPLISPEGLLSLHPFFYNLVYLYFRTVVFIIIGLIWLLKSNHKKIEKLALVTILFVMDAFVTTIANNGNLVQAYISFMPCVMTCLIIDSIKNDIDLVINSFLLILEFWIYVNLICMILYPTGMYYVESNNSYLAWIFGYKSSFQYYILPVMCFEWINYKYRSQKVRMILLVLTCCVETIISHNMMLLVGVIVLLIFLLLNLFKFEKVFNMRNYLLVVLLANIMFIFMTAWLVNSTLGMTVLGWLGKSGNLSYRVIIWPKTLKYIQEKIIYGNGILDNGTRTIMYGLRGVVHSHNQLLEITFIGGITMLFIYVLINLLITKRLMENKELESSRILSLSIFVVYLMVVVEIFTRHSGASIWAMLFCAYFCKYVDMAFKRRYRKG